jgi:hypothetical protein
MTPARVSLAPAVEYIHHGPDPSAAKLEAVARRYALDG